MPRGGGGRGRGRRAVRILEPVLLLLLHYGHSHGYTLLGRLGEFGLGPKDPSVIYRALRSMEERGWVASTWDEEETQGPPRRVYSLTEVGNDALAVWICDLAESRRQIDALLAEYRRHLDIGIDHRPGASEQRQ